MAENNFADYKLKIGGLVENPVELSLEELKEMGKEGLTPVAKLSVSPDKLPEETQVVVMEPV